MKRIIIALLSIGALMGLGHPVKAEENNSGVVVQKVALAVNEGYQKARLWLPYPLSRDSQVVSDVRVEGNYRSQNVYSDPHSGAVYLYAEWDGGVRPELTLQYHVTAQPFRHEKVVDDGTPLPPEVKKYTENSYFLPTDGQIGQLAAEITEGKHSILEKARAIYDWTVANTYRDPDIQGCGLGIVEQTLAQRGGKCADISSVFISLLRAAGVPALDIYGLRLSDQDGADITGGYHCWAQFYVPGTGWVTADPADVRRAMLNEKLNLDEAGKWIDFFWLGADGQRFILQEDARGVTFNPAQDAGPLNYFMYPYAEVDGQPLNYLDSEAFGYKNTFYLKP